jgi:hypothetical protein
MIYLFIAAALLGILAGQYAEYRRFRRYWSRRGFPGSRNRGVERGDVAGGSPPYPGGSGCIFFPGSSPRGSSSDHSRALPGDNTTDDGGHYA